MSYQRKAKLIDRLAEQCGFSKDLRRKWMERGGVPYQWHHVILAEAEKQGIKLNRRDLRDYWCHPSELLEHGDYQAAVSA